MKPIVIALFIGFGMNSPAWSDDHGGGHGGNNPHHGIASKLGMMDGKKLGAILALAPFEGKPMEHFEGYLRDAEYPEMYQHTFKMTAMKVFHIVTEFKPAFHGGMKGFKLACMAAKKGEKIDVDMAEAHLKAAGFPLLFRRGFRKGFAKGTEKCTANTPEDDSSILESLDVETFSEGM